jgi:hypothetical protein
MPVVIVFMSILARFNTYEHRGQTCTLSQCPAAFGLVVFALIAGHEIIFCKH